MSMYQCCYTNLSSTVNGVMQSGWQAVALSPGIPSDALSVCTGIQAANSTIRGAMVDESGQTLNLLEIVTDANYLYLIRTRYGLTDRVGRANMFSQAFVLPWGEGADSDPNKFLTIADDNFKTNEEEAQGVVDHLVRTEPMSLSQELGRLGLGRQANLVLVRSVVARLTEDSLRDPLYVQYDGTPAQLRSLLYCIYAQLPRYLRRALSVASAASTNTDARTLVFSTKAHLQRYFVDPFTGENSILDARMEGKLAWTGYYDYVPQHLGEVDAEAYFSALDGKAQELGDRTGSNPQILRIAHQLVTGYDFASLEDPFLKEEISNVLLAGQENNAAMDQLLGSLLELARERDLGLPEGVEKTLAKRVSASTSEEFRAVGDRYLIYRFSAMPVEDAAKRLAEMRGETLAKYLQILSETKRGCQIVDAYYTGRVQQLGAATWDQLDELADEAAGLRVRTATAQALYVAAHDCYARSLGDITQGAAAYDRYIAIMGRFFTQESVDEIARHAKLSYWRSATLDNFVPGLSDDYAHMAIESGAARALQAYSRVVDLLVGLDENRFLRGSYGLLEQYGESLGGREAVLRSLEGVIGTHYRGEDENLAIWLNAVCALPSADGIGTVVSLRKMVLAGALDSALDGLEALVGANDPTGALQESEAHIARILIPLVKDAEEKDEPYLLDTWLLLGRSLDGGNPFGVLDVVKPWLLEADPEYVVANSCLGEQDARYEQLVLWYLDRAEEYVEGRGSESKAVKRWAKETRKLRGEPAGGLLGAVGAVGGKVGGAVGGFFKSRKGGE